MCEIKDGEQKKVHESVLEHKKEGGKKQNYRNYQLIIRNGA